MSDGTVELIKDGKTLWLHVPRLRVHFVFSTEDDCRQAEMLAEQIELAYQEHEPFLLSH